MNTYMATTRCGRRLVVQGKTKIAAAAAVEKPLEMGSGWMKKKLRGLPGYEVAEVKRIGEVVPPSAPAPKPARPSPKAIDHCEARARGLVPLTHPGKLDDDFILNTYRDLKRAGIACALVKLNRIYAEGEPVQVEVWRKQALKLNWNH
jgi:hypothetical protein